MQNGYDINRLIAHFEVDGVRKPMKQCSANIFFDLWKLKWRLHYSLHYCIKLSEEAGAKPGTVVFNQATASRTSRSASSHRCRLRLTE